MLATPLRVLQWVRVHQPRLLTPLLVAVRTALTWARPGERERARAAMRLLVPERPAAEIEALAREHVRFACVRSETRYRPRGLVTQDVTGLEHLAAARDRGRGVVLTTFHHGHFVGSFSSIAAHGFPMSVASYVGPPGEPQPVWLRYLLAMIESHPDVETFDVRIGFRAMADLVRGGRTVMLTCDGPGHGPDVVTFLDRQWRGFTSVAGLAYATGAAVVPISSWRQGRDGGRVELGRPLLPEDHADAHAMTRALLASLEPSVRAWPDGYDVPLQLWVPADPDDVGTPGGTSTHRG